MSRMILRTAACALVAVFALLQPQGIKQAQACSNNAYIGGICIFGGNFTIRGWAMTNGQLLDIGNNSALFSLLGTVYGGDGRTTFGLPDTRGRVLIGFGQGPGLSDYRLGQRGGAETVTLTVNQIPSHTHTAGLRATDQEGTLQDPTNAVLAANCCERGYSDLAPNVNMNASSIVIGNTGGGQSHENRPPYLAVNYLIAIQGLFPSRN